MSYATVSRDRLLVEAEWLARRLGAGRLRVEDIRGLSRPPDQPRPWYIAKRDDYPASHVPGANQVETGD